jgi:hypothetical protein
MNIKHLEMVMRLRLCPACSVGMTREIGYKLYQCDHSRCGERFDLSHLTDQMIGALLEKKAEGKAPNKETT